MDKKNCFICGQPLHEVRLGKRRVRYLVHRGAELNRCTAIHPDPHVMYFLKRALRHIAKNKERFKMQYREDGNVMVHGEKPRT